MVLICRIELLNNNSHGLSPPGGLVSPSGGFVSLLCDQGQTETTYSTYHERVFQIQASIIFECYVSTSSLCKYKLFVCIYLDGKNEIWNNKIFYIVL